MSRRNAALLPLLLSLSTLPLAGCSILTTAKTEPPPLSAAAVATAIGHIRPSPKDTCDTQVQVAEQSSKIATLQTGKEAVYKAACTLPAAKKPAAVPPSPPKPPKVAAWDTALPIER